MSAPECHPDCVLGTADHPGYLEYRCIDDAVNALPFPGEKTEADGRTPVEVEEDFHALDMAKYEAMKEAALLADERADVLARFNAELTKVTGDGSKKRQAGTKPPWHEDDAHEGAIFSHLTKWKRGETIDPDSGAHTLVHLAWRALAIACRETGNTPHGDRLREAIGRLEGDR